MTISVAPLAHAADEAALRQVVGILDYVASDYAGAVGPDGTITDESEYHEQAALVSDAAQLATEAGLAEQDPVRQHLSQLDRLLADHARPDAVREACRALRHRIVEEQGLVLEPPGVPDLARARKVYRELGCVDCHGERGDAQTSKAATLDPHPANFLDRDRVADVSPFRAFHALTFGVKGTAMPSFDIASASDRWDLAFYVLAFRHQGGNADLGRRIVSEAGNPVAATASRLSQLTERDILAAFPNLPPDQGEAVLAWLRGRAPFERDQESRFALARQDLRDGVTAYARGDASTARRILVQAYLRGIEPHEAGIRARAPALLTEIEGAMGDLRQSVAAGAPADQVEHQATRVGALLDRAEEGATSTGTAFAASATIALREGLEMVLLVTALLAVAKGTGAAGLARAVHGGWLSAIPAGIATWFLAGHLLEGIGNELAEGIVSLLAALVLLGVTHWVLGQVSGRGWMKFLSKQLRGATQRRAALPLFVLSFFAVYREFVEVVLFYRALLLEAAGGQASAIWMGIAAGIAALGAVALVLRWMEGRLKPAPLLLASSVLLALLALVLVGKGVHAFQEAGILPLHRIDVTEFPSLGFHASREVLAAQAALAIALIGSAVGPLRRARRVGGVGTEASSGR